jgi:hypothetical protein
MTEKKLNLFQQLIGIQGDKLQAFNNDQLYRKVIRDLEATIEETIDHINSTIVGLIPVFKDWKKKEDFPMQNIIDTFVKIEEEKDTLNLLNRIYEKLFDTKYVTTNEVYEDLKLVTKTILEK